MERDPRFIRSLRSLVEAHVNAAANYKGNRIGIVVTCEGGEFRGGRGGGIVYDNGGKKVQAFKGDGGFDHFPSFIRGVNSRKELDLGCTLETGFMSSCVPFMTNASYKAGEAVSDETVKEYAYNNGHVFEAYERFRKHLGDWNTDFSKEKWTLGSSLEFNGRRGAYTGGDNYREANEFVKSDYQGIRSAGRGIIGERYSKINHFKKRSR